MYSKILAQCRQGLVVEVTGNTLILEEYLVSWPAYQSLKMTLDRRIKRLNAGMRRSSHNVGLSSNYEGDYEVFLIYFFSVEGFVYRVFRV